MGEYIEHNGARLDGRRFSVMCFAVDAKEIRDGVPGTCVIPQWAHESDGGDIGADVMRLIQCVIKQTPTVLSLCGLRRVGTSDALVTY